MAAANTATDSAPAPVAVVAVPACQRKNSEDNGWMGKFQDFFQTPMEEHKACWKVAVQKMTDELKDLKEKSATKIWKTKDEGNQVPATEDELKDLKEKSATKIWKTKDEGNQVPATEESSPNN